MPDPSQIESRLTGVIGDVFASGRPLTYIHSAEEQRVATALVDVGRKTHSPVWTWSLTEGMRGADGVPAPSAASPRGVLDFIIAHENAAIFHLQDFHEPMRESAEIRRRLRDLYESCLGKRKFVVISSPVKYIPEEIERSVMFLELRPPDLIELVGFLGREIQRHSPGESVDEATLYQFGRALQGLTLDEARYALQRAQGAGRGLGPQCLPFLLEEKRLLVNRSGFIEFIGEGKELGEIGGLQGLKTWLVQRRKLFHLRDSLTEEIMPKGVLLMGIPGCGKSLSVKAIASCFELPLYRVDMIEIFSGRHGKPEGAFVQACRMMEEMAPAVLWFDEIEMGITSANSGGEQGRIFAFFLTWMQENARGLFVAATANRIDLLPAEMIRKGRFDEVFFVDLPHSEEQVEIFRIHLGRRGVDTTGFNLQELLQFTAGWSGAEIEQCVIAALTQAKLADRVVTEHDLITIAAKIVPLSRTMKEQISQIRGWAFERAVRASPR
jgi:SpoVK/Ycf46/Vps4 family AAA+-type ATPase